MGCCGAEDDDILKHLIPDSKVGSLQAIVISPLNSNFSALVSPDILRCVFERLPLADLARASCVCRTWHAVASDPEMKTRAFKSPWRLRHLIGRPSSPSFWRDNSIRRFAISHRLLRGDTVAGLAIRYSVQ